MSGKHWIPADSTSKYIDTKLQWVLWARQPSINTSIRTPPVTHFPCLPNNSFSQFKPSPPHSFFGMPLNPISQKRDVANPAPHPTVMPIHNHTQPSCHSGQLQIVALCLLNKYSLQRQHHALEINTASTQAFVLNATLNPINKPLHTLHEPNPYGIIYKPLHAKDCQTHHHFQTWAFNS